MTTRELRAAAGILSRLHLRFSPLFGRKENCEHSMVYLRGLLLGEGRKSAEPLALSFAEPRSEDEETQNRVLGLQRFVSAGVWDSLAVQREIQAIFAEESMPSAVAGVGTVAVVDGSTFLKKGTESVGVARQYSGRAGKVENCQAAVFVIGVAPAGVSLLDEQLYLPKTWIKDKTRREKTRVPKEVKFRTKTQIAMDLLQRIEANGLVQFDWVVADEEFGRNGDFLDNLETRGQRYLVGVPKNTTFWTVDPSTVSCTSIKGHARPKEIRSARHIAAALPPKAWERKQVRDGAAGPLVYEFACVRLWAVRHRRPGPATWLVMRRSLGATPEISYFVSNAGSEEKSDVLALVSSIRWRVEEFLEECKSYLGMADYEARGWISWHHHMSLVALAHLFVTLARQELKSTTPELTLDMAVRILKSALPRPELTEAQALEVMDYHLRRNRTAKNSHHKTWHQKHKKLKFKVLL
jgi:SRSO17 transposase